MTGNNQDVAGQFNAACAAACPHCAAGSQPRWRPETSEYVHDFSAQKDDIDTPSLRAQGGPARLLRGTFAHVFCLATGLRRAQQTDIRDGFLNE